MRFLIFTILISLNNPAFALPQHKRILEREYQFKTPCAICHTQGGGSGLSVYGKAFEKNGKNAEAVKRIASIVLAGDKYSFGAKLKAKADPNDPKSTPDNPGDWAGGSGIPTDELKTFAPADVKSFSLLEGELKAEQIEKLKLNLGENFLEEDKYPTFYFGEVAGKKKYVVQYLRLPKIKRTLGLAVDTSGTIVNLSYVGAQKSEIAPTLKNKILGKTLAELEKMKLFTSDEENALIVGSLRGLSAINSVFKK